MGRKRLTTEEERKIDWRRWSPIPDDRLAEIVRDTAKDDPDGLWTAADVYRIAAELLTRRMTDPAT